MAVAATGAHPQVVALGYPKETAEFQKGKVQEVKEKVMLSQKKYTLQVVMVEDQTEIGKLDESTKEIDESMDALAKVTETFRKGIGSHIKKLSV